MNLTHTQQLDLQSILEFAQRKLETHVTYTVTPEYHALCERKLETIKQVLAQLRGEVTHEYPLVRGLQPEQGETSDQANR